MMKIHIELGPAGSVGTKATVTRTRWFRKPDVSVYACYRAALLLSAKWINEATGMPADESLAVQLNEAAQAAARLADKTPNAELTGRASAACEGPR